MPPGMTGAPHRCPRVLLAVVLACGILGLGAIEAGCNTLAGIEGGNLTPGSDASADAAQGADAAVDAGIDHTSGLDSSVESGSDAATQKDSGADVAASDGGGSDTGTGGETGGGDGGCAGLVCAGTCVANDTHNCGTCGNDCTALPHVSGAVSCTGGQCSFPLSSCAPGWTHCSANIQQGCETDESSASSCGGCGVVCPGSAPVCSGSGSSYSCVSGCPPATPKLCGGTCVDTASNPNDCATCGNACPGVTHGQPTCASSACGFACNSGFTPCGGACVDTTSDPANCNGCGLACTGGKQCVSSACQCPAGTNFCGGSCVADGPAACGPSCAVCSPPANATPTCSGSTCGFTCTQSGYSACGGACVDLATDNANCGACGRQCPALTPPSTGSTCTPSAGTGVCVGRAGGVQDQSLGGPVAGAYLYATEISFSTAATVTGLGVSLVDGGGGNFQLALYAGNSSGPTGNPLGIGALTALHGSGSAAGGVYEMAVGPIAVGAGTYWVVMKPYFTGDVSIANSGTAVRITYNSNPAFPNTIETNPSASWNTTGMYAIADY
jgi:hypothetical protein